MMNQSAGDYYQYSNCMHRHEQPIKQPPTVGMTAAPVDQRSLIASAYGQALSKNPEGLCQAPQAQLDPAQFRIARARLLVRHAIERARA